jgi:class 3 adenylate cyclase
VSTPEREGSPLPEHPELRTLALAMEHAGISGEISDATWRLVFISSEEARIVGVEPAEVGRFYGKSLVRRQLEDAEIWATSDESSVAWWRLNVPVMRAYLDPDKDPALFDDVFAGLRDAAARVAPVDPPPRAWSSTHSFPDLESMRTSWLGDVTFTDIRINGDDGEFLGVMRLSHGHLPDSLMHRLARGDRRMYERMERVSAPARRSAAVLFADLEASGDLSRRLSSRAYFELIRDLTDHIDSQVIDHGGIVGKHAGDGASALFLVEQQADSETATAAAAIRAARAIRDRAAGLGPEAVDVLVNVGVHWGDTLMVGQVATGGRLEVTALGDAMNEAARIENAATKGTVLASKQVLERLDSEAAAALDLDPNHLTYTPLAELEASSDKVTRDAGTIPVAAL